MIRDGAALGEPHGGKRVRVGGDSDVLSERERTAECELTVMSTNEGEFKENR